MDRRRDGIVRGENGLKAGWDCPGCEWIEGGMGLSGV